MWGGGGQQWVGLSGAQPDFGNTLARVMQIKATQQQGEAAQADIEANNRLAALINPEFAARLAQNDPQAIAAIAATGSRGLNLALPLMQQARQPNQTRQIEMGGNTITQEWDPQTRAWRNVATAPRWQPQPAQRETFGQPVPGIVNGRPAMVQFGSLGTVRPAQDVAPPPERNAPPSGYVWGPPDANGVPTLRPITGGPAEYITQQITLPDGTIGLAQFPRTAVAPSAPQQQPSASPGPPMSAAPWATGAQGGPQGAATAAPAPSQPAAPTTAPAGNPAQPERPTPESLGLPEGTRILSTGPGRQAGLTEAQAKANMFGLQMQEADQILGDVRIPNTLALMAWRNAPESVVNMGLSPNDQRYFNAVRLFAAGILRKETGAAFTNSELLDVQSRFFPMPGDSREVIAQKEQARRTAIQGIQAELPGQQFRRVGTPGPGGRGTAEPPPAGASRGTPPPPPGFEILR